jgi:hypothetical protein
VGYIDYMSAPRHENAATLSLYVEADIARSKLATLPCGELGKYLSLSRTLGIHLRRWCGHQECER